MPTRVFERVHIDFAGPVDGFYYFVVVDAFSKWPEIVIMKNITGKMTVKASETIYSKFGYPETIVSDNGTQFTSAEFAQMCSNYGIKHIRTAPYHPQSNGQAERFVDTLKRGLRKLKGEEGCPEDQLQKFLFNYRATPNSVLDGKAPCEVFLGRKLRTRLSLLIPSEKSASKLEETDAEKHFNRKNGVKSRDFTPGDHVLIKKYIGTKWIWKRGIVKSRIGSVNYSVILDDKEHRFHANQMRKLTTDVPHIIENQCWLNQMLYTFSLKDKDTVDEETAVLLPTLPREVPQVDQGPAQAPAAAASPRQEPRPASPAVVPPAPVPRRSSRPTKPPNRLRF